MGGATGVLEIVGAFVAHEIFLNSAKVEHHAANPSPASGYVGEPSASMYNSNPSS
jgi:hypothetical protein